MQNAVPLRGYRLQFPMCSWNKLETPRNGTYINGLSLGWRHGEDDLVLFLVEFDRLDVVEHWEEMRLDGVRVRRLTQDLQQRRVRHEEKPQEQQPLLLQVSV